jgi:hypothetical protein
MGKGALGGAPSRLRCHPLARAGPAPVQLVRDDAARGPAVTRCPPYTLLAATRARVSPARRPCGGAARGRRYKVGASAETTAREPAFRIAPRAPASPVQHRRRTRRTRCRGQARAAEWPAVRACEAFCAAVGRRLRSEKRPFALFSRRKKLEETRNLGYCFS